MSKIHTYNDGTEIICGRQVLNPGPAYVVSGVDVGMILDASADFLYAERIAQTVSPDKGDSHCWGYEVVAPDFTHHIVESISYMGRKEVFDIEVEKHHNFVYDGVVVSNSSGTAFDINYEWNQLGQTPALVGDKGSVRELVPVANKFGFYWGGHYPGRKDGMHFEICQFLDKLP